MFNEFDYLHCLLLNSCNVRGIYKDFRNTNVSFEELCSKCKLSKTEMHRLLKLLLAIGLADISKRKYRLSNKTAEYDINIINDVINNKNYGYIKDADLYNRLSYIRICIDELDGVSDDNSEIKKKLLDAYKKFAVYEKNINNYVDIERFVSAVSDPECGMEKAKNLNVSENFAYEIKELFKKYYSFSRKKTEWVLEYSPCCKSFLDEEFVSYVSGGEAKYIDLTSVCGNKKISKDDIRELCDEIDPEKAILFNSSGCIEELGENFNRIFDLNFFASVINENEKFSVEHLLGFLSECFSEEPDRYIMSMAGKGFVTSEDHYRLFINTDVNETYASASLMEKKSYSVRYLREEDIDTLIDIDRQCWDLGMNMTKEAILGRIRKYPEGQFGLISNDELIGSVYSQRINDINEIMTVDSDNVFSIHRQDGDIIQLISVNILPKYQNKAYGDMLLEFILCFIHFDNHINDVVAVTRFSEYSKYKSSVSKDDYLCMKEKNGLYTDGLLRFHQIHGADIKCLVNEYRKGDVVNDRCGILVQYDLSVRKRFESPAVTEMSEYTGVPVERTAVMEYIKETIEEEMGINIYGMKNIPFMEIGIDSIELYSLGVSLSSHFNIKLPAGFFFTYGTAEQVTEQVCLMCGESKAHDYASFEEIKTESLNENKRVKEDMAEDSNMNINKGIECAIIGVAVRLPGNVRTLDELWNVIEKAESITCSDSARSAAKMYSNAELFEFPGIQYGGFLDEIDKFDNSFFNISNREAISLDPQLRLLLEVSYECFENAGILLDQLSESDTGIFIGCSSSDYVKIIQKNGNVEPNYGVVISNAMLANRLSYFYNLHGPSQVVDTACSSSMTSLHNAVLAVKNGDCGTALAAGINLICEPSLSKGYYQAGMLSKEGKCKTFDNDANGYVRSEGIVAILIKDLSAAVRDGNNILGVIKGSNVNHGGKTSGVTVPNAKMQAELIKKALVRSGLKASDISLIEAHGTGTPLGDPIEVDGLKMAFEGDQNCIKSGCALGSSKSVFGHLEAASGLLSVAKALVCINKKKIPTVANFNKLNSKIELENTPFYIPESTIPWKLNRGVNTRIAGISNFGSGGANAHVIISEYNDESESVEINRKYYIICLSALNELSLEIQEKQFAEWLEKDGRSYSIGDIEYNLNNYKNNLNCRRAYVVSDIMQLKEMISSGNKSKKSEFCFSGSIANARKQPIFESMGDNLKDEIRSGCEDVNVFCAIAELYVEGHINSLKEIYNGKACSVNLPAYCFDHARSFWIDTEKNESVTAPIKAPTVVLTAENANKPIVPVNSPDDAGELTLKNSEAGTPLVQKVAEKGKIILETVESDSYSRVSNSPVSEPFVENCHSEPEETVKEIPVSVDYGKRSAPQMSNISIDEDEIKKFLLSSLSDVLFVEESDIDTEAKFVDIGLDSILSVEWIKKINNKYNLDITATKVYDYPTITEFCELMSEKLGRIKSVEVLPDAESNVVNSDEIKEKISKLLGECIYCDSSSISYDAKFVDLGLDSVLGVEFVKSLNEEYGTKLNTSVIYDRCCIDELGDHLEGLLKKNNASSKVVKNKFVYSSLEAVLADVQNGKLSYEDAEKIIEKQRIC